MLESMKPVCFWQIFLGSVIELEYTAVAHLEVAAPLMEEFVEALRAYLPSGTQLADGAAGEQSGGSRQQAAGR